ncbi:MAG: hypothetical protein ACLUN9_12415 [Enterocloster aldenensis]
MVKRKSGLYHEGQAGDRHPDEGSGQQGDRNWKNDVMACWPSWKVPITTRYSE